MKEVPVAISIIKLSLCKWTIYIWNLMQNIMEPKYILRHKEMLEWFKKTDNSKLEDPQWTSWYSKRVTRAICLVQTLERYRRSRDPRTDCHVDSIGGLIPGLAACDWEKFTGFCWQPGALQHAAITFPSSMHNKPSTTTRNEWAEEKIAHCHDGQINECDLISGRTQL